MVRFGTAIRDITPPYPVMLHGYAARNRRSGDGPEDRVTEPLSVRALCVEGLARAGTVRRVVILALDTIGVHAGQIAGLRQAIQRATRVDPSDLLIAATHTHFAPAISPQLLHSPELGVVEPDARFVAAVTARVVEAVSESVQAMVEGELEEYRVEVPSVLFNRRTVVKGPASKRVETNFLYPAHPRDFDFSPVDPQLTAFRFRTASGPKAALLTFGCHPVTGGLRGELSHYDISADYPYYVRKTIEDAWGCPVLFCLGAAGDAVPMRRMGRSREHIGATLGSAVLLGERAFASSEPADSAVDTRVLELEAKTIVSTLGSGVEEAYRKARERLLGLQRGAPAASEETVREATEEFLHRARLAYRARLYPEDHLRFQIQLLRLGQSVLVALPFEVLSEISLRIKRAFPNAVVVSVANGYEGYLPLAYEYERGGYEATAESTHVEIGTADRVLERVLTELATF
ncbi:MAG TPA: hypothetical protein VFH83_00610 [Spirochaetia bacterium]|nr:hypothetical protein [Spirochaetia bacterium]